MKNLVNFHVSCTLFKHSSSKLIMKKEKLKNTLVHQYLLRDILQISLLILLELTSIPTKCGSDISMGLPLNFASYIKPNDELLF